MKHVVIAAGLIGLLTSVSLGETVTFSDKQEKVYLRSPEAIVAATRDGDGSGDADTEAAVVKVLWWLKENQKTDPSNPDLGYWGGGSSTLANTALAVLTYLAHGEYRGSPSPYEADFGPVVSRAINYLVCCVQGGSDGKPHMKGADGNEYAFLIVTYALCEAFGMTRNEYLRNPAQRCLQRIIEGQSATGGWDYKIDPKSNRDDVSFAGWALQALNAGKMAGVFPHDDPLHDKLEKECLPKAIKCLKTRNFTQGGFNYVAANKNATGLTATGCLAMQLLGYGKEKEVSSALEYMRGWKPAWQGQDIDAKNPGSAAQYYCYYATQCKYQAGMKQGATQTDTKAWQDWNKAMKALYTVPVPEGEPGLHDVATPAMDHNGKAHKQGYYTNKDAHTSRPVMDTCLAALQLMVYYRYPPSYVGRSYDPAPYRLASGKTVEPVKFESFRLNSFMGLPFGRPIAEAMESPTLTDATPLEETQDVRAGSRDARRLVVEARRNKPFRKFDEVRLHGFAGGALAGVELVCPRERFSDLALRLEEFEKVVSLLESSYGIPLADDAPGRRVFTNGHIQINVWLDRSWRGDGGIHIKVTNRSVVASELERIKCEEEARRREEEARKKRERDRERVAADKDADMLLDLPLPEFASVAPTSAPQQARVDVPPKPKQTIRPKYPEESRQRGEEGDVLVEIDVTDRGGVAAVRVVRSSGYPALDAAALNAARQARFTPAKADGRPVPTTTRLPLTFRLKK